MIVTAYRSPKGSLDNFIRNIDNLLFNLKFETLFLCGDFNIDFSSNSKSTKLMQSRQFLDLTAAYGLQATITEATRVTKTSSTIIDNIFTNLSEKDRTAYVQDPGISDHKSQIIIAKVLSQSQRHEVKSINKMIRKYNDQSLVKMQVPNRKL